MLRSPGRPDIVRRRKDFLAKGALSEYTEGKVMKHIEILMDDKHEWSVKLPNTGWIVMARVILYGENAEILDEHVLAADSRGRVTLEHKDRSVNKLEGKDAKKAA
jgi:hypothetical protein